MEGGIVMRADWEEEIRQVITEAVSDAAFPEEDSRRMLDRIHSSVGERRRTMRLTKKQTGLAVAAALVVLGSITAVGAGRIASLSSSVSLNAAVASYEELKKQGETSLGQEPKIAEQFSGGQSFERGFVTMINAADENGQLVGSYPEVSAEYSGAEELMFSVSKPLEGTENPSAQVLEEYQGIAISGSSDEYLFLPPDAEPSEEDKKLEEEGKLYISYGTDEEERRTFKSVSWMEDGLRYQLYTYGDVTLEDLTAFAKEVIDNGR